ncbi:hypothetical protein J3Q64DRAFT_1683302 [Phycomyces blakesleeanus]|uniref:Actin-like ATPase domain-containing protein n=1 Tax=Phycomyces blakesleeanus TaxID=4837 RepID=A0ABR3API6_PHYBL
MSTESNRYKLVIAMDFGTTFSGCHVLSLMADPVSNCDMSMWRFKNEQTTMFYKKRSKKLFALGKLATNEYETNPSSGYYVTKVKLWLDRTIKEDLPSLPHKMTPVQIIADYLRQMHKSVCQEIRIEYPNFTDLSMYRYCMAVPTMWSEQSKQIMKEAAVLAGIIKKRDDSEKLLIVDEAVAAALHAESKSSDIELTNGSIYMVCDAGGGTVDLATFEKDHSVGENGIKELTMGTGSSCGSAFLETRFEDLVKEHTLKYPGYNKIILAFVMEYFATSLKRRFGDRDKEDTYMIDHINKEYNNGHEDDSDYKEFSLDEIRTIVFDPIVDKILGMIEKQFEQLGGRSLDVMFITGGFGQSPYLQKRIKDTFADRVKHFEIPVLSYKAVMEGAALFGANPRVITQRILRRTYGIKMCSATDKSDNDTGTPSKRDQFYVCVRKGSPVNEDTWITKKIAWNKNILPIISLYAYDGDEPIPEYPTIQEIDLVSVFNTKFPLDQKRETSYEIMAMKMRFGLDKIEIRVNIAGREFEYVTVWDVTGEKKTQNFTEPNPPFSVKLKKWFLMEEIVKHLP